jgi:hypothetical protein
LLANVNDSSVWANGNEMFNEPAKAQHRAILSYRPNEVALQPFSGVVLAACYAATMTEDANERAMAVMQDVKQLLDHILGQTTAGKGKTKVNEQQAISHH